MLVVLWLIGPANDTQPCNDWDQLSPAEQSKLIERFNHSLAGPVITRTRLSLIRENGQESILPIHFASHEPSCMGKAQIVAAFAKRLKLPTLLFVPVTESAEDSDPSYLEACKELYAFLQEGQTQTDFSTLRMLLINRDATSSRLTCPSWMHGVVAMRCGHEWLLVDPNRQTVDRPLMPFVLDERVSNWQRAKFAPGLTSVEICISRHQFPALLGQFRELIEKARVFKEQINGSVISVDRVIELLFQIELARPLAEYCKNALFDTRRSMVQCLSHLAGHDHALNATVIDETLENMLPSGELLKLVVERIPHAVCHRAFRVLEQRAEENSTRRHYPVMEYGKTNYLLAVHTLGHLGVNYGVSNELEPILANYCYSQFRTWRSLFRPRDVQSASASDGEGGCDSRQRREARKNRR